MRTDFQTARSRKLRVDSTDAERKLWAVLRNRQVMGTKFRRQVPSERYFADFACESARLVVELDGSQHAAQSDYDGERTRVLELAGWRVLRFWNNDVIENIDGVGTAIMEALKLARP